MTRSSSTFQFACASSETSNSSVVKELLFIGNDKRGTICQFDKAELEYPFLWC
jgi:hypothetical protein